MPRSKAAEKRRAAKQARRAKRVRDDRRLLLRVSKELQEDGYAKLDGRGRVVALSELER